jgi:hypothetical protein
MEEDCGGGQGLTKGCGAKGRRRRRRRIRGCIQKFPDWLPGAKTANDTSVCNYVQFHHGFMSQSVEFCRHNPLSYFSTSVYCCKHIFRYGLSPKTFGYPLV